MTGRPPGRWIRAAARLTGTLVAVYALAGLVLGLVPVNRGFVGPPYGVELAIVSNGFHADLVMPVRTAGMDWTTWLRPPPEFEGASHVAIGWGDRQFYLATPTLADLDPLTALRAIAWSGDVALHLAFVGDLEGLRDRRRLVLPPDAYRRLAEDILAQFRLGQDGRPQVIASPGYGPRHLFVAAQGTYSPFRTCNEWLAERLRAAGVRTGLWAPFTFGVTAHL